MRERIYTQQQLINMDKNEWKCLNMMIQVQAYRLLGMNWHKWITIEENPLNSDIIFRWE